MIPVLVISGLNSAECTRAFTKKSSKYHPLVLKKYVRFTIFFVKKVQHSLGLTSFALEAEIIYNPSKKHKIHSVTRPTQSLSHQKT